jgi:hypothetical protein
MSEKIFEHRGISAAPYRERMRPTIISASAARGGPLGGRLLAMMIAAIVLVVVGSALLDFLYRY